VDLFFLSRDRGRTGTVCRSVVSAVSCLEWLEWYDDARDVVPLSDAPAACAGQHITAAAIVPPHQISLDRLLTEQHSRRILNMAWCDIAMRLDLS
jgi:hypothetical protein